MEEICDLNIRRQKLWLCNDIWLDVFKLLSRRQLVSQIQPVHRRFHLLCESAVDNVHLIRNFNELIHHLAKYPSNQMYRDLAENNCDLGKHFRLAPEHVPMWVTYGHYPRDDPILKNPAYLKRHQRMQMCVLRHSLELFRGCCLQIRLPGTKGLKGGESVEFLAYLRLFEQVRPVCIELSLLAPNPIHPVDELLREPALLDCHRLGILLEQDGNRNSPGAQDLVDWLHHKGIEAKDEKEAKARNDGTKIRCLNLLNTSMEQSMEELVERCIQKLLEAEECRPFVLIFVSPKVQLKEMTVENQSTGEVLTLESVKKFGAMYTPKYRLSRLLAKESAQREQLFGELFEQVAAFTFDSGRPTVVIS